MNYSPEKREITLNRKVNNLDKFVIDFTSLLDNYVIVSGYVSILLGRTRATEDVDLLTPKMSKEEFSKLWIKLHDGGFWCINTPKIEDAWDLLKEHAIRFGKGKNPLPNMEFKIIKNDLDQFSYENKLKVLIGGNVLYISPIELQIAYKLFLGSEKDIEDARHLYKLLKDKINKEELLNSLDKLEVKDKMGFLE